MPALASRITRTLLLTTSLAVAGVAAQAQEASTKQLAPGFTVRAPESRLVILPADMELFSISAGPTRRRRTSSPPWRAASNGLAAR